MLIPLTRKKFEDLIPVVATADQYAYYWGKLSDLLKRLLISVVGVVVVLFVGSFFGEGFGLLRFIFGVGAGMYWLWGPVLWASLRNIECRKYQYSGFWQGEVLDVYITEELIGKEETVNKRGDLVIVENRERCINLEMGDESDFTTRFRVPIKRNFQAIAPGDTVEMLVLSHRSDLGKIGMISDIYIPDHNLWVSDYPYLRRDMFIDVSRRLQARARDSFEPERPRRSSKMRKSTRKRPRMNVDY
jgi:hypothetical protein